MSDTLKLIVPIYRDLASVQRCLNSVLAHSPPSTELILINDATPEPEVATYCRQVRDQHGAHLIEHHENKGFVASVNEGSALFPEQDFIILNSDTEVPPGWLDRLQSAAAENADAASITPFSNNATICSYPNFCEDNALPEGLDHVALDTLFSSANHGLTLDIPTGVGFCMYVRRAAWNEVGEFDQDAFGRGYGEENDWCLRAAAKGWRHLLCADLFVYHAGGVSFGESAGALQQSALQVISERYPDYEKQIADFIERDPIEPLRFAIDQARALAGDASAVLAESRLRARATKAEWYQLDQARHEQVSRAHELLAEARAQTKEQGAEYSRQLQALRQHADEQASQNQQLEGQYRALEGQYQTLGTQYSDLETKIARIESMWLVRLYRTLTGRRGQS